MAANLFWGKEFRLKPTPLASGETYGEVSGIDVGCTSIAWSSVAALEELAERCGVGAMRGRKANWPIYRDCEVEADIPLEDTKRRSTELRAALESVPADVIENDYWLSFVVRLLRQGNSFFVMV